MKDEKIKVVAAAGSTTRATLTSLPQEVLGRIVKYLHGNDKIHLALCCKATLPTLCMGSVRVRTDNHECKRHLHQAIRRLTEQPGGVWHLEVFSRIAYAILDTRHLVDLRLLPCLCKLTLDNVVVSLPALQPVATQLRELKLIGSCLRGSADDFLTKGWTALISLTLFSTQMENAMLTAALELPALEDVHICWFKGHRGGELQLHQLTGSCPQVSRLKFQLGKSLAQATDTSRQSCRLLNLSRLADLHLMSCPGIQARVDLDLPPSLTQLSYGGYKDGDSVDFFWVLQEVAKCIGQGAQLHKLICDGAEAHLQPAQWGADLDEQYRRLGGQLDGLRELEVWGAVWDAQEQLLSAMGAVASAAPSLVRLVIALRLLQSRMEVSPVCSASLESIRVECHSRRCPDPLPPLVLLTFLPGCTRLQEVVVHIMGRPVEGAAVKIRCHCCSQRCIVLEEVYTSDHSDLVLKLLPMPSSEQGVQEYTVLYDCHAAGPEQAPLWGHTVMPGIL